MAGSELTAGEKTYLESGGQDASALLAENPGIGNSSPALNGEIIPPAPAAPAPAAAPIAAVADPAAAPASPDAPEPGEEELPTPDGKGKRRMVDSRALKEARTRAKSAEEELQKYRDNYTRVDERLKMLSAAVEQPDPAPAAPAAEEDIEIDPDVDVIAAVKALGKTLKTIQATTTDMRTQTDAERQASATISTYQRDAAAYRVQMPDFNDAYNFLLGKRGEQLKALGYSDKDVSTSLFNEEMNLVQRALSMQQSPAQQLYALAQSMGYAKAAPKLAEPAPAAAAAPAAVPAAPAAPQIPSVTAEIDRIKAGQLGSRSLSTGGGAAGEELSLETLANMPQKEFAAFMDIPGNRERVESAMGRKAAAA